MSKRVVIVGVIGVLVVIGWISSAHRSPAQPQARTSQQRSPSATARTPSTVRSTAPSASPSASKGASRGASRGGSSGRAVRALAQLKMLPVVQRHPSGLPEYRRSAYGEAWVDVDHNGCNQRDDVLFRDAVEGMVRVGRQGACDHDVLAGTWHDPYTGRTLRFTDLKDLHQADAIQIDHIVPLAEAWRSGASGWSPQRREAYANDLRNLLAVDGPTNQAKSADDPAAWRPRKAFQCTYAVRWVATKSRWHLGADLSERVALGELLERC